MEEVDHDLKAPEVPEYQHFLLMLEFYWIFDPVVFDQTIFLLDDWYLHFDTWHRNTRVFFLVEPNHMRIYSFRSSKFCKTYDI